MPLSPLMLVSLHINYSPVADPLLQDNQLMPGAPKSPANSPPAVLIEVLATNVEVHANPVTNNLVIAMGWSRAQGEMMYKFTLKVLYMCTNLL